MRIRVASVFAAGLSLVGALVVVTVVNPGCTRKPRAQTSPSQSPAATRVPQVSESPSPPARREADPGVYLAICSGQFGGDLASIQVYRSATGDVHVLELEPDIDKVSHPPTIFYDPSGTEVGAIPEQPVVPGSPEALEFDAIRTRAVGDAVRAENVGCRGLLPPPVKPG